MRSKKKTLLWQLEGDLLQSTSYVFGTMHVKDQIAFRQMEALYPYIDSCEALATEIRLDEIGAMGHLGSIYSENILPLDQYFRPKVYLKMRKMLKKVLGIELNMMKHMPPFFILNILNEQLMAKDMPVSLDEHLSMYAKQQNKQLLGIETLEEQLMVLQKIPLEFQLKSLRSFLANFSKHRRQLLHTADLYASGDPIKIYRATRKGSGALRKLLLFDRNALMADRIFQVCQSHSAFVAIGAGHLAGGKGVLRYLKLKGLKLSPIPMI